VRFAADLLLITERMHIHGKELPVGILPSMLKPISCALQLVGTTQFFLSKDALGPTLARPEAENYCLGACQASFSRIQDSVSAILHEGMTNTESSVTRHPGSSL
jgi:hypothetical protein